MMAIPVSADAVDAWADRISWHLQSFCRSGQRTPEGLLDDVRNKHRQLWLAVDGDDVAAAMLTSVASDETQTLCLTHAAGRSREDWVHLLPKVLDWGRSIGCQHVEAHCRPGWEKTLREIGLRKRHIVMEGAL